MRNQSSEQKAEFVEHLLNDNIAESTFFRRLKKAIHEVSEHSEGRWLSWTKVLTMESEHVIKLSLKQSNMEKRPSIKLDNGAQRRS